MKVWRRSAGGLVILSLSAVAAFGCSGTGADRAGGEAGGEGGLPGIGGGASTSLGSQTSTFGGSAAIAGDHGAAAGSSEGGAVSASGGATTSSGGATSGGTTSTAASGGATSSGPGALGGCSLFTSDDDWNKDVSGAPVDAAWTARVQAAIESGLHIHPDYGNSGTEHYGIPINVVPASQAAVGITFDDYPEESDPGPYPFPDPGSARIEGGTPDSCDGDCHFLVVQGGTCMLYEGYACHYSGGWHCSNGAKWDLSKRSYGQRPKGWTSADAAGLPVMPGLVRLDEVRAGAITHAIRFTMNCSRPYFVAPATHEAVPHSCDPNNPNSPPMGLRLRLDKTKFDISTLSPSAQVVARAMQTYGIMLADNGSDFFFQGEDNPGWTEQDVEPLKTIPASAFVVVTPPSLEN